MYYNLCVSLHDIGILVNNYVHDIVHVLHVVGISWTVAITRSTLHGKYQDYKQIVLEFRLSCRAAVLSMDTWLCPIMEMLNLMIEH